MAGFPSLSDSWARRNDAQTGARNADPLSEVPPVTCWDLAKEGEGEGAG